MLRLVLWPCLGVLSLLSLVSPAQAQQQVVATIGRRAITVADVDRYIRVHSVALKFLKRNPKALDAARAEALAKLVQAELLIRYGYANDLIKNNLVEQLVQASINSQGGSAVIQDRLKDFGIDYASFRQQLVREARQSLVVAHITKDGWSYEPNEAELQTAFRKYRSELQHGESYELESIELDLPRDVYQAGDIERKARQIVGQLQQDPAKFRDYWHNIKDKFGTTGRGAYSGWVQAGALVDGLARVLKGLEVGQVSAVAHSAKKLFIMRLLGKSKQSAPTFEASKAWLRKRINVEAQSKHLQSFIEQLQRQYQVEVDATKIKGVPFILD